MTRHQMRESAFLLVFERIFRNDEIDELLALAKECESLNLSRHTEALFRGVDEKTPLLDAEIEKHLKNWTLSRISKVALAVLRLAVYEIDYCKDIDIDIAISEAIKIAQEYTTADDVSFINGVLSSVSKERKACPSISE